MYQNNQPSGSWLTSVQYPTSLKPSSSSCYNPILDLATFQVSIQLKDTIVFAASFGICLNSRLPRGFRRESNGSDDAARIFPRED